MRRLIATALIAAVGWAGTGGAAADPDTTGQAGGQTYRVGETVLAGATDDGTGTWRVRTGRIDGGDPAVAAAFNAAATASAEDQIAGVRSEVAATSWRFDAAATLIFRPAAIAQWLKGSYYGQGAAHPINTVSTVVIDAATARPITLAELFVDEQAGLNRLSEQTRVLFPQRYGGTVPMPEQRGNRPVAANFANWLPTAEGMQLCFADYQLGHGAPTVTVPWAALADLLSPIGLALSRG